MRRNKRPQASKQYWIGYCRKSTDTEDKQVHTLQDQAGLVQEYYARLPEAERRCPLLVLQEAQSAYRPGRPVFNDILRRADRQEVRGLIVVHPNRVSRNHADSGAFVQRLVEGAIPSLDTTGGKRYTGADSNDIFMLTLEGAMSWKDSRDKGDRVRQAMRMRAAEGKHMGLVRIGYRGVSLPDGTRVLEQVPEEAIHLRRLFELAATGAYSVQALVAEAARLGLRSRNGKRLGGSAIHSILRDPLYKGYISFDGIVARGRHEPLIDEMTWNRVQEALTGRRTGTEKPKDPTLRDLFVFGNLLKCPACGRCLSPYRVKGRYVYYECKNLRTRCRMLVPQASVAAQLRPLLDGVRLGPDDLDSLRGRLLRCHEERSRRELGNRGEVGAEYEKVTREIGEVFAQRKEAEAMGLLEAVDARLAELRGRRDELQARLDALHDRGDDWIETVVRSFRLFELLQEAIFVGSWRSRDLVLRALASNYTVRGREVVPQLRSPFRQVAQRASHPEWCASLYDVRTEVAETVGMLEAAYSLLQIT